MMAAKTPHTAWKSLFERDSLPDNDASRDSPNRSGMLAMLLTVVAWAIAATLEPVVAGVLAWFWFGQTLTLMQIVGGLTIVLAITWMQFQTTNPNPLDSQ
jgi:hypothetical protein